MKTKNAVIIILVIIIVAQFAQYLLLLRKFDRLKFTFENQPVEVYVAGLTERVREIGQIRGEIIYQNRWLSRRLDKCIEMLEQQKGLEPIPIEYPELDWMRHLKSDPNTAKKYELEPVPFYEPYEGPNTPSMESAEEGDVRKLMCLLNLHIISLKMYLEPYNSRIENYDKRLKRLEDRLEE